jgi:hypothetical protein
MTFRKKYKFESGGNTQLDVLEEVKDIASKEISLPLSPKTPLRLSNSDDLFEMNYDLLDVLNDQIKNLIYTEPGERLCFPNLGTSLKNVISRNDNLNSAIDNIANQIKNVITAYAPGIILNDVSAEYSEVYQKKYNIPVALVTVNYSFFEQVALYNNKPSAIGSFNDTIKRNASLQIKIGLNN